MGERPRVLIERWMPVKELGIECRRENSTGQHPPPNRLHVWWARRPLILSRAAVLASVLPYDTDTDWFLKSIGILGDPVAARERLQKARAKNERVPGDLYGYKRAFTYCPPEDVYLQIKKNLEKNWGNAVISILDPMAGGGSIPFEASKYGFKTFSTELNPVAHIIQWATLKYPVMFGLELVDEINYWAQKIQELLRSDLAEFYPEKEDEQILDYIFARVVKCPECGLNVPLSPNWWLGKQGKNRVAVKVLCSLSSDSCSFELISNVDESTYNPDNGTVARGVGKCPRCGGILNGDYIKQQAHTKNMGYQLYALFIKKLNQEGKSVKTFRLPEQADIEALQAAELRLKEKLPQWENNGWVPGEIIPDGEKTKEAIRYGFNLWQNMFSPRQLLFHLTHMERLQEIKEKIFRKEHGDKARAIVTYLAFIFDKCIDRNSYMSRWVSQRGILANTFDRHDFSFKWSFGEMNPITPGSSGGYEWAVNQVVDAYKGLVKISPNNVPILKVLPTLELGSASNLAFFDDKQIHAIVVDPPYYDNVMYAELSDFFYVWMKRTLGDIYPEVFFDELTNKDDEAVANPARFKGLKGSPAKLAEQDYESKMQACFEEMHRVLRDDGVLTLMFTHKRVDAWDTLANALIEAGFEITASWPINTEFEHSLHQARKNAAASTILLVCRKRDKDNSEAWWEDIQPEVRSVALAKAEEFESYGIEGVDLFLSTFGPVLGVLSRNWPVKDRSGDIIRPDLALNEARAAVTEYRIGKLLQGRKVKFDAATQWYILAWDIFRAVQFPFDEARKLALSVGLDTSDLLRKKLYKKSGNFITLCSPKERARRGMVDPNEDNFASMIDAIHTAMLIYQEDGLPTLKRFYSRTALLADNMYVGAYQALLTAMPEASEEYKILNQMAIATM